MKYLIGILLLLSVDTVSAKTIELNSRNTISFVGPINAVSADTFIFALMAKRTILPIERTLYVIIVSGGGEVERAGAISEALNLIPNIVLICRDCESAAAWIFESTNHPRLITKTSVLMTHQIRRDIRPLDVVNFEEFKLAGERFNLVFHTRMQISKSEYEEKIRSHDWVIESNEMIKRHLADAIVIIKCDGYVSQLAPVTCSEDK